MARPIRDGIDYFPLDVVLDEKFELLEAQFGLKGFAVLIKLYQRVYGSGYFCEWNQEVALLFAHRLGLQAQELTAVVETAVQRGLFDRRLFERCHILTSRGIQARYFEAVGRRKRLLVRAEYLLVQPPAGAELRSPAQADAAQDTQEDTAQGTQEDAAQGTQAADAAQGTQEDTAQDAQPDDVAQDAYAAQDAQADAAQGTQEDTAQGTQADAAQGTQEDAAQGTQAAGTAHANAAPGPANPDAPRDMCAITPVSAYTNPENAGHNPQRKGKKSKEEESREKESTARAAPKAAQGRAAPDQQAAYSIPLQGQAQFTVNGQMLREWAALYPAVDVAQELRHMRGWCEANPHKRKTKNGVLRFVHNWLRKAQQEGGSSYGDVGQVAAAGLLGGAAAVDTGRAAGQYGHYY